MQISIYFELLRRRKRTSLYLVLHSIVGIIMQDATTFGGFVSQEHIEVSALYGRHHY